MLAFYCQHFDTVEINNSFYRLPVKTGLENWRDSTPDGFCLAAKGSRFITHMKKLKDPVPALARYFERIDVLGEKLGPILFQLPPNWNVDVERLKTFVAALPSGYRYAFEFRELSWMTPEVNRLLERYNAAFCIYELAGYHSSFDITADFAYVRLHGPSAGKYQGSYSHAQLRAWARRIEQWSQRLKAVYMYFDNDQAGYAAQNALELKQMIFARSHASQRPAA